MMTLLSQMFKRASIESPSTPLSAAYDLLSGGNQSQTGIHITENKALGLPGFWKGVNIISRAVGKTPIVIKKRQGNSMIIDRNHPAWFLLRKSPSGISSDMPMTPFVFKQVIQAAVLIVGNGYAYIIRDEFRNPKGLIWLDPRQVVPLKENGKLIYLVTLQDGSLLKLENMDVLHIKGLSYDGITGYSIIDVMKDNLGLNLAYQMNQSVFFKNGMRPGWVIEVPFRFRDQDAVNEFRKKLGKVHQGIERSYIPAILENGAVAKPLTISHEDAQFIESREFDLRMLANIFFLPSSKFNDVAKVAYNSLEQENQSTLDEAYEPWFVLWEEELEYKLLSEEEKIRDTHKITFERRKLVQTPLKDRLEGYNKGLLSGWLSRDEVREWEDLNPMSDDKGKQHYIPVNVTLAGEEKEMDIEDERVRKIKLITENTINELSAKLFNRRIAKVARIKSQNSKSFMKWLLDDLCKSNRSAFVDLLEPQVKMLRLINNDSTDVDTTEIIDNYLDGIRNGLNQIAGLVGKTELVVEVDKLMLLEEQKVSGFVECLISKE